MTIKQLARIKACILCAWAPAAYATTVTLGESLGSVPTSAWAMVAILSAISGLAALLQKLKDGTPDRMALFVCANMVGSLLSGLLTFFVLSGIGTVQDFFQVVLISVAAYAGAALLDGAADALSSRLKTLKKADFK